jgi:hypothetical protein
MSAMTHRYMEEEAEGEYYAALLQREKSWERLAQLVRDIADEEHLCKVLGIPVAENPWARENPWGVALDEHICNIAGAENFPKQFLLEVLGTEGLIEAAKKLDFAREYRHRFDRDQLAEAIGEILSLPPLRCPSGLTQLIEKVIVREEKIATQLQQDAPNIDLIRGCIVTVFRILERVFRELLEFYLRWRFGDDKSQFGLWLTDAKCLNDWNRGRVTLGTYRTIFIKIEEMFNSTPDEVEKLEKDFGRTFLINPPRGTRLQSLSVLPDKLRDYLNEIQVSIQQRNAIIHWTGEGGGQSINLLEAVKRIKEFLNYLSSEWIFPQIITVVEQGNHYIAGARVRVYNERGEYIYIPWGEPLELYPTQYYFSQTKQRIFIKRLWTEEEPD